MSKTEDERHELVQQALTDKELNDLLDEHVELFKSDKPDDTPTSLAVIGRSGFNQPLEKAVYVVLAEGVPDDDDMKEKVFMGLGAKLVGEMKSQPVAVVFTSEAWFMDARQKDENRRISEHARAEGKQEGVIISATSLDGRGAIATYVIERNKAGEIVEFKEKHTMHYDYENGTTAEAPIMRPFWKGVALAKMKGAE